MVLISAYTEGLSGDITFEEYYGGLKSDLPPITEYYVKNNQTRRKEKRTIHTGEEHPYYVVSFKKDNEQEEELIKKQGVKLSCSPNPLRNRTTIKYLIPEDGLVRIYVHDIYGKRIKLLKEGRTSQGVHSIEYNGTDEMGSLIRNGIYFVRLEFRDVRVNAKVVVIR